MVHRICARRGWTLAQWRAQSRDDRVATMAYEHIREKQRRAWLDALPEESMTGVLDRLWLLWGE